MNQTSHFNEILSLISMKFFPSHFNEPISHLIEKAHLLITISINVFFLLRIIFSCRSSYFHIGFRSFGFLNLISLILVSSSHSALTTSFNRLFSWLISFWATRFSIAISAFQTWHDLFLSYEKQFQNWNFEIFFSSFSYANFDIFLIESFSLSYSVSTKVQNHARFIFSYNVFLILDDSVFISQAKLQTSFHHNCI
jgi:hypothetical protein